MVKVHISPRVERTVTVEMTESEARDFADRYAARGTVPYSIYPGERVLHAVIASLLDALRT